MYPNFSKVVIELVHKCYFWILSIISLATLIMCVQFSLCTKMLQSY